LALDTIVFQEQGEPWLALMEASGSKRGRGFFLFRGNPADSRHLLQAPHRHHDRSTGELQRQLFLEGRFRAAAWNTLHRREVDLARVPHSYFIALARATQEVGAGWVIQLHGFAKEKRKTVTGRASDLIVSSGHPAGSPVTRQLAECLRTDLPFKVVTYPEQVDELGGTRNPVGRALRNMDADRFLHLEMSAEFRDALLDSAGLRRVLISCLQGL